MRYQLTFRFADSEAEAAAMCAELNRQATRYMRKNHPANYTPWQSLDGREKKFVVLYYC